MRVAFAFVLTLHGIAHLVGFLTPWGLMPAPASSTAPSPSANALFGGRLMLGDAAERGLGVIWLIVGLSFAVVAIGFWRREPWSVTALLPVTIASLALSTAWWPVTRIGVLLNVVILMALVAAAYLAFRNDITAERQRAGRESTIIETKYGPIEYATLGQGSPILAIHGTGGHFLAGRAQEVCPQVGRLSSEAIKLRTLSVGILLTMSDWYSDTDFSDFPTDCGRVIGQTATYVSHVFHH